ncbi:Tetratricopeptide repeat-containing protein [Allopseudospirillum japonicum]|uniref:Tetratricopeptide repeat-containing protein n=1 Tax=Allopseudospirillum japonicum TaxID=64971 RepID=A0A1H6TD78_9GAMM|nr:tetratricopeptide repeat protein [Allopseudospirillum japonicum]SEI77941.1 Tetratricopeptide repeat-containing protein [Allopseudospirillum japonicum]
MPIQRLIQQAEHFLNQHEYVAAEQIYLSVLELDPQQIQALLGMSLLSLQCAQLKHAQKFVQQAQQILEQQASSTETQVALAWVRLQQLRIWQAQQAHQKVIDKALAWDAQDVNFLCLAAQSARMLGAWSQARSYLEQAQNQLPEHPLLQTEAYTLAYWQPATKDTQHQAAQDLLTLVRQQSQWTPLLIQASAAVIELELPQALEVLPPLLGRLHQLDPQHHEFLALYAGFQYLQGKTAEAEIYCQRALDICAINPWAYLVRARVYAQQHRYRDANAAWAKLLTWQPGRFEEAWQDAQIRYIQRRDAKDAFQRVLKIQPLDPSAGRYYALQAFMLAEEGQYAAGAKVVQGALQWVTQDQAELHALCAVLVLQPWLDALREGQKLKLTKTQKRLYQSYRTGTPPSSWLALNEYLQVLDAASEQKWPLAYQKMQAVLAAYPRLALYRKVFAYLAQRTERTQECIKILEALLEDFPKDVGTRQQLMRLYAHQGDDARVYQHERALVEFVPEYLQEAIQARLDREPENPRHLHDMAVLLAEQPQKRAKSLPWFTAYLAKKPQAINTHLKYAGVLRDLEDFPAALQVYEEIAQYAPEHPELWLGRARVYLADNQYAQAQACADQAYQLRADETSLTALAHIYQEIGVSAERVLSLHDEVVQLRPDASVARWNRALARLQYAQDYPSLQQAMQEYDHGFAAKTRKPWRQFKIPQWQGESLAGKTLLLWREQGVGDEIQASRYYAKVIAQIEAEGGHLILECTDRLLPLFRASFASARVRIQPERPNDDQTRTDLDYHFPVCSLIGLVTQASDFTYPPQVQAHYRFPEKWMHKWQTRIAALGSGLKIGLCWRSGMRNAQRNKHYATLEALAPLMQLPGVTWVNLTYSDYQQDLVEIKQNYGVDLHTWEDLDLKNDFAQVACMTSQLDLVISAASAPAPLSAASGTPVWCFAFGAQTPNTPPYYRMQGYPILYWCRHYSETYQHIFQRMADQLQKTKINFLP